MPASKLDILNGAAVKLGVARLASENEDSENARVLRAAYDRLLRAELRRHAWSFALRRANLAELATPPLHGFDKAFGLPTDFLRLVSIRDEWVFDALADVRDGRAAHAIEGRDLLCDESGPLPIRYVAEVTDASIYDATFVEVMACRLALDCVESLTKKTAKRGDLREEYALALAEAKRCNAIELPPVAPADGSWVTARFT